MAFTITKVTGVGTGASTFLGSWDVEADGATAAIATIIVNGGANTPNLNFASLLPSAGGNTAVATTIAQALKVKITPTTTLGGIWYDLGTSTLTTGALTIGLGAVAAGKARVYVERATTFGE